MKKLFYKNSGIDGRFYRLKGWKARRSGIGIKVPFKVDVTEATQKEMSEAYQIMSGRFGGELYKSPSDLWATIASLKSVASKLDADQPGSRVYITMHIRSKDLLRIEPRTGERDDFQIYTLPQLRNLLRQITP